MESQFKNFVFNEYTQTIRTVPENHWIASVKDNTLIFDSWDASIQGRFKKIKIKILWEKIKIKRFWKKLKLKLN